METEKEDPDECRKSRHARKRKEHTDYVEIGKSDSEIENLQEPPKIDLKRMKAKKLGNKFNDEIIGSLSDAPTIDLNNIQKKVLGKYLKKSFTCYCLIFY